MPFIYIQRIQIVLQVPDAPEKLHFGSRNGRCLCLRIDFFMAQQPLHLFDRHSLVDCRCGHGPAKLMRMYMIDVGLFTHLSEHHLHTAGKKAIMRMPDGNDGEVPQILRS